MPDYQKLYILMFNAATNALDDLDHLNIGAAKRRLKEAQSRTEELYISQDENDGGEDGEAPAPDPRLRRASQKDRGKSFFI